MFFRRHLSHHLFFFTGGGQGFSPGRLAPFVFFRLTQRGSLGNNSHFLFFYRVKTLIYRRFIPQKTRTTRTICSFSPAVFAPNVFFQGAGAGLCLARFAPFVFFHWDLSETTRTICSFSSWENPGTIRTICSFRVGVLWTPQHLVSGKSRGHLAPFVLF